MSDPVRTRRNRRDTAVRGTWPVMGAMVSATEYSTGSAMVEVHAAVPRSAREASIMHPDLLPR